MSEDAAVQFAGPAICFYATVMGPFALPDQGSVPDRAERRRLRLRNA